MTSLCPADWICKKELGVAVGQQAPLLVSCEHCLSLLQASRQLAQALGPPATWRRNPVKLRRRGIRYPTQQEFSRQHRGNTQIKPQEITGDSRTLSPSNPRRNNTVPWSQGGTATSSTISTDCRRPCFRALLTPTCHRYCRRSCQRNFYSLHVLIRVAAAARPRFFTRLAILFSMLMNTPQFVLSQRSLEVLRFVHTVVHPVENLSLHCNFCSSCLRKARISSSSSRNSLSAQSTFSADGACLTEFSMKHNTISHTLRACTPSMVRIPSVLSPRHHTQEDRQTQCHQRTLVAESSCRTRLANASRRQRDSIASGY